jgi:hypothetical protein
VQCGTNAECPTTSPLCDQDQCVQCMEDRDCPTDLPKCNNKTCVAK